MLSLTPCDPWRYTLGSRLRRFGGGRKHGVSMARKKPLTPDSFPFDFDGWPWEPWPELDLNLDWEPWDFQWEDLVIDWPGIDWPDLRFDFWDTPDPEKP